MRKFRSLVKHKETNKNKLITQLGVDCKIYPILIPYFISLCLKKKMFHDIRIYEVLASSCLTGVIDLQSHFFLSKASLKWPEYRDKRFSYV